MDKTTLGDRLRASEWEVRVVALAIGDRLVRAWHYAKGGSNTATYLHGLFPKGAIWNNDCVGVAWWIPPTKSAALATYPDHWEGVLSLSRLVIGPMVPKNGATFLLAGSMRLIDRRRWPCLVTYADEWRGHKGGIYRASNWEYCGLTKPESVFVVDGRMTARKAGGQTRTHAEMLELGAENAGRHAKHKFRHIVTPRREHRKGQRVKGFAF